MAFLRRSSLKSFLATTCVAASMVFTPLSAQACTSFVLTAGDGSPVYGRTMEFGIETRSGVSLIPKGYTYAAQTGADAPMSWTAKHNVIAMNAFDDPTLVSDGMNEAGMAGGILYFPGFADYAESSAETADREMAPGDFLYWALANFETVDQVKKAVEAGEVVVVGVKLEALGAVPPFHYTLHDKDGNSIVIEPVDGGLKVFDNPTQIMTNSPGFEWHLTNLRNFVNLSPVNKDSAQALEKTVNSFGQGSGWLGLPGDPTPPSRFIRAASFVASVKTGDTAEDALRATAHVLNNFDIPVGWIQPGAAQQGGEDSADDYTQWSVMADMKNGAYYVRSHDAMAFNSISFGDFQDGATEIVSYTLPERPAFVPLSSLQQ
ncbi:choloylglycine hydrolase [Roseibium aquae]|uniref:Choloylglycine hydrolase n=1 Tax=Roseibium aquae TaxID=1323746 RepID=A0A916TGJ4_9HYPH|nr:choloylglycine hydrolase family protein [Roseibium aquae]GGB41630.1 choloylglycine hydrolase [Roseibium aquae]